MSNVSPFTSVKAGTSNGVYMNTLADTLPYYPPRVLGLTPVLEGSWLCFEEVTKTIIGATSVEQQELESFMLMFRDAIARIELFHWRSIQGEYRGVILFDSLGSPLVHYPAAIVGTPGSNGSDFTRKILERLGIQESDINELNRETQPYHYKPVVFSREVTAGDPKVAVLGSKVKDAWEWWFTEGRDD